MRYEQSGSNEAFGVLELRLDLLKELDKVGGKDIIDQLVGYSMSQSHQGIVPLLIDAGLAGMAHYATGVGGGFTTLAALAASQSPKVALYGAYGAGRGARAISDIGQSAKAQVEKGKTKLSEITSRK